jgi:hypothetical protein
LKCSMEMVCIVEKWTRGCGVGWGGELGLSKPNTGLRVFPALPAYEIMRNERKRAN